MLKPDMNGPTSKLLYASNLSGRGINWYTAPPLSQSGLSISPSRFDAVTDLLLERPNLNSSHLFRADILLDSAGTLLTPAQKEGHILPSDHATRREKTPDGPPEEIVGPAFPGFTLQRSVVRRLIPRKPQLDRALEQSCFIYGSPSQEDSEHAECTKKLVVYWSHVDSADDTPWYHPPIQALAYLHEAREENSSLSVHYLPFVGTAPEPPTDRLARTMKSLLATFIRLAKHTTPQHVHPAPPNSLANDMSHLNLTPSVVKDTVIPQHLVQDTYTRLKQSYAADLIARWVEKTEPAKHVFEDLSIAAFLIELWKRMYSADTHKTFPGFVDIACGNGVLTYILINEGYRGGGFDARRRKTWDILGVDEYLTEQVCVPKPLLDTLQPTQDAKYHNGVFSEGTFIISNHADELTLWTPLLAALSGSPFLAIPCCSHALSGAKHRYPPPSQSPNPASAVAWEEQPKTGDLAALRAAKHGAGGGAGKDKSTYACLTRKLASISQEIGFRVEVTLMRIPSTRNIGVVCRGSYLPGDELPRKVAEVVERECQSSSGVEAAARMWTERAQGLVDGKGRGKVNLKSHQGDQRRGNT